MAIILKCVGWLLVGAAAFALVGAIIGLEAFAAVPPLGLALATFGFCILGIMVAAFGEIVGHLAAIDRATAAQFVLLDDYGRRKSLSERRAVADRHGDALRSWVDRFA